MPLIKYAQINLTEWKLAIVDRVNLIIESYKSQGYELTLRQVYYQFVSRDWLPQRWADPETRSTNNQRAHKNLGDIINDGRMARHIDWNAIEDRTRNLDGNTHWSGPQSIIDAVAQQYAINKWEGQHFRPEVWVEKDALEGVVGRICRRLDVPFFSCRGYTSQTSMWDAGQRLKAIAKTRAVPVILHLGDHDPSGIDMSRDIENRIRLFMDRSGKKLRFDRLALNMDQVEKYSPPPNPAKVTDSRCKGYMAIHGEESWELDALDPTVITEIIRSAVDPLRDDDEYAALEQRESTDRHLLKLTSENWQKISRSLMEQQ